MADWQLVDDEIARIFADNDDTFGDAAIAHIRDFVRFIRERTPVPEVGPGYWRTSLRVTWPTKPGLEIEVFADRIEVYRFREQATAIQHLPHVPGTPFPGELEQELDQLRA